MRKIVWTLLVASLAACGDVKITPVDHSCVTNPGITGGSGCAHGH